MNKVRKKMKCAFQFIGFSQKIKKMLKKTNKKPSVLLSLSFRCFRF
ncbi:hypothetical protein LNTAR_12626 [Lentisphaera araneosa HTCC2155]|uniref:Uncharacterized protein n=1 Tax=Lentisphaera araneosa HTCC2155 TaxID=313628 RepID=A6DJX6_9BACT|nr:hypothetical protein LNTAR_12626 [Lentisphaera araneosa HTCC2155]